MIVFPLNQLLGLASQLSPETVLTLWGGGCTASVVLLVLALGARRSRTDPFKKPAKPRPRHALGDLDRSQAGIPAADLIAAARLTRAEIASHRIGSEATHG